MNRPDQPGAGNHISHDQGGDEITDQITDQLGDQSSDLTDARGIDQTTFGFQDIKSDARQNLVNEVFSRVADNYDLMNDVMSGGLHRLWKNDLINWMAPPKSNAAFHLLDVAGGTGDVALKYLAKGGDGCTATLCDINGEMLKVGRAKAKLEAALGAVTYVQGNAEYLPFPDKKYDVYTIAFGIRNVTNIQNAIDDAYRVLKTGGRFMCLEFSEVQVPLLDKFYDAFSFKAIPKLGKIIANDEDSYRYLVESIRNFPKQEKFASMIRDAGFEQVSYRNLSGGIAAIHSGWRL